MSDMTTDPVELPGSVIHWLEEYKRLMTERRALDEKLEIARAHVELALGDAEIGLINGAPVVRYSFITSHRFDQKKAKEILTPEQVEACTTVVRLRRFEPYREENQ